VKAEDLYSIAGKVVVTTGGANGLGFAMARAMTDNGARVVIVDVDDDAATRAVEELTARGGTARSEIANLADGPTLRGWRASTSPSTPSSQDLSRPASRRPSWSPCLKRVRPATASASRKRSRDWRCSSPPTPPVASPARSTILTAASCSIPPTRLSSLRHRRGSARDRQADRRRRFKSLRGGGLIRPSRQSRNPASVQDRAWLRDAAGTG
jgi:hypothetical protein